MLKIGSNEGDRISVTARAYDAIQKVDVDNLSALPEWELRPLLPCLVRMALCSPLDQRKEWSQKKKTVLKILSGIELVNSLVALLSIDFHALEIDVKKEQQLRLKLGVHSGDSILASSLQNSLALEFERSDSARKLRLVLSELLSFIAQTKDSRTELGVKSSDLFDNDVYLDEVSDVMCIAHAELPGILHIQDIAETLIHLKNGPFLLCRLIANAPDSFSEVCLSLISNGEKQDEDTSWGCIRMQALHLLCQMNPHQALVIRAKAVEMCRMPGLAVLLTLSHCNGNADIEEPSSSDLVAFVSGILLGSDDKVRTWFAQYVRNCQKKGESGKDTTLQALRDELLQRLQRLLHFSSEEQDLSDSRVVQANSLLRLFCALRGIAGLKFTEEEVVVLVRLLTSHPPPSPAGIRFVSLGLCMLLACPSLVLDHEKQVVQWIQWLMEEESYFGRTSGVHASFGEMLLLIAIHFHGNQVAPITELVCSTLGMKIPIRQNSLSKMKNIFTLELFTDQVVTAHAVKVAVTPNLSSNTIGFLPVHCIYQLLKSRAFTKHKVRIKDWVYKQICASIPPLHPILPALVEVYVNSVIVPSSKGSHDTTNEPLSEEEISVVFGNSLQNGEAPMKQTSASAGFATLGDDSNNQMAPQLLLLYYLLLYEDTRLNSMKAIVVSGRKVKRYSGDFLAQLPMRYLVVTAQRDERFAGLFPPLLRLLATHYPHLCMVDDWLRGESGASVTSLPRQRFGPRLGPRVPSNVQSLAQAFSSLHMCPIDMMSQLDRLNTLPLHHLWPYAQPLVTNLPLLLQEGTPRQVIERVKQVWWRLNEVFPRRLWVMTTNALRPPKHAELHPLCLDDLIVDPLHVLRCDIRVFRCAPLLELVLHMLRAFLAASRTHLNHHLLEHPVVTDKGDAVDKDREELRVALVAVQESAAVQILLECCLATEAEKMKDSGFLTDLREIQTLICTHLHQVFIGDPNLVRLVHFQGYPSELLPISVSLIPSMHICLDFIPELLSQPQLEKQVFAIELASYLCLQYSIAKSLSIARLCVNVTHTLLGVLPGYQRPLLFLPALPALVRMCKAFPPLSEDVSILLLQLGRVCLSQECTAAPPQLGFSANQLDKCGGTAEIKSVLERLPTNSALCRAIQKSFADLCDSAVLNRAIY